MEQWMNWAIELQAIAQAGLTYSNDKYDIERFERIRELSAEIISAKSGLDLDKVKDVFCNETGYQTPKLDTRAAIFKDGKILLVQESATKEWSLPGGWMDVNQSVKTNVTKEVKEEAGLEVTPNRIIALLDRNKHNIPIIAHGICKVFVLCDIIGGEFKPNIETSASGFFSLEELPPLSVTRNTKSQIEMCFDAYRDENWKVIFD